MYDVLAEVDDQISKLIDAEQQRQHFNIELIASENIASLAVRQAQASVLSNKYAEGYPKKRYYGGCHVVDQIEELAIHRACQLFDSEFANVQPHSGSQANMAVYFALLDPYDKVLAMDLKSGGHLTHGAKVSFSGMIYNFCYYGVDYNSNLIDYEQVKKVALAEKPKLIIAGGSAYSRIIDFAKFKEIADLVGAYLMVDMAHFAGLVAANLYPSPLEYADVVTSTTHKTLRGPRGGLILTNNLEIAKKINKAVFPTIQGGPLLANIAGKAVAFKEALQESFITYSQQVINNAKYFAQLLQENDCYVISKGTDTHLLQVDVSMLDFTGKQVETLLDDINITCNKNTIPFDLKPISQTSGIRIGTPFITSRGFKEAEIEQIVKMMVMAFNFYDRDKQALPHSVSSDLKSAVKKLCNQFPLI